VVMADLWAEYDSLRYRFGRKATSVAAARKAIEDSIRAEEAEKWREALEQLGRQWHEAQHWRRKTFFEDCNIGFCLDTRALLTRETSDG
jgi:thermostable 8-oxoguanine DNA glycosylase